MVSVVFVFEKKHSTFLILSGVCKDANSWYLSEAGCVTTDRNLNIHFH